MWQMARNALSMLSSTISGLEVITGLAHSPAEHAVDSLDAISSVVTALIEGFQGKIDAKTVENAISLLAADLKANDNKADAELIDRFRTAVS